VSGQDQKFPPTPGTNQIAGFREFRPLTSQEKIISNIASFCETLTPEEVFETDAHLNEEVK